jgi:galactokinase
MASDVPVGVGLSSSAAYEVAVGRVVTALFDQSKTSAEIAFAGKYAENEYFGKPCGLLDQMASSVGGFVQMDFKDPAAPVVHSIQCDLRAYGYSLCIVDTKGSHAGLTDEYAAIPADMRKVARCFGADFLRDVDEAEFYGDLSRVRHSVGDRAALRAVHFFRDNALAIQSAEALRSGDFRRFFDNIVKSGRSSFTCLQNVFSPKAPDRQGLTLALDICERILEGNGAWRVHGGGFAGSILAFVPYDLLDAFRIEQDAMFGEGACHTLSIRPIGSVEVTPDIGKK